MVRKKWRWGVLWTRPEAGRDSGGGGGHAHGVVCTCGYMSGSERRMRGGQARRGQRSCGSGRCGWCREAWAAGVWRAIGPQPSDHVFMVRPKQKSKNWRMKWTSLSLGPWRGAPVITSASLFLFPALRPATACAKVPAVCDHRNLARSPQPCSLRVVTCGGMAPRRVVFVSFRYVSCWCERFHSFHSQKI
jgi:hypothetical protein